jgi:nucleoside-diphosphate-sugar epimerase
MKDTKILVTGGSGLLGSYILRWFLQQGYTSLTATCQNPEAIPNDLREGIDWVRLILPEVTGTFDVVRNHEWVIHSAAFVSYQPGDKYKLLEINKTGTEIIVNACLTHQVKHLIYIGSIGCTWQREKSCKT